MNKPPSPAHAHHLCRSFTHASRSRDVAFKLFRRNRPDTMLMARSMQPDQILEKLKMDEIDIGITMRRKGAESTLFDSRTLYEDEFALMMSSTHKLASNEALAPTDIVQPVQIPENFPHEPDLNKYLVERLDKAGINHVSSGVIDDMESMPLMLSDRSKTVVSCKHLSGKFGSRFKHIPLADVDLSYEICALWKNRNKARQSLNSLTAWLTAWSYPPLRDVEPKGIAGRTAKRSSPARHQLNAQ